MKKIFFLIMMIFSLTATNVYASSAKVSTQAISQNQLNINVHSNVKIQITGYTISKGSNITVYYIQDENAKTSDSINIDLATVIRPYRIRLVNSNSDAFYEPFSDITSNPMKDYIRHLYDIGFVDGYEEDNTFRPDNNITRGEMFTLMSRYLKLEENPTNRKQFDDLANGHWAYEYAIKVADNKLVEGYSEEGKTLIKLDKEITVAEAIKFINDSFKIKNINNTNYDVRFANHWAKSYVQNLLNEDIIDTNDSFYKDGNLNRPITRGEVSMLISRALGR